MRYNFGMNSNPRQSEEESRSRELKTVPLNIRVSEAEKKTFARAAEVAGVALSSWMRERLRVAALRELDNIGESVAFLGDTGASNE